MPGLHEQDTLHKTTFYADKRLSRPKSHCQYSHKHLLHLMTHKALYHELAKSVAMAFGSSLLLQPTFHTGNVPSQLPVRILSSLLQARQNLDFDFNLV
mmetsp:Transcript_31603/g.46441  ORF Transcript_31603/g.46441 Transcript_31603/m.46441 type:complete len:98 (+) Transcript_31603:5837-6130(+)